MAKAFPTSFSFQTVVFSVPKSISSSIVVMDSVDCDVSANLLLVNRKLELVSSFICT
ncbi:hypothetical protein Leryth_007417 [Lithospermum erythrorhizon]|nr:hypothetical protein Leryth_007417 [Lithospermum erythrorhizon]